MARPHKPARAIREYFLLSEARATSRRLSEAQREAVARQLGLARQRSDAADALWTLGHTAEGLRLAAESLERTVAAADQMGAALGPAQSTGEPANEATPAAALPPQEEAAEAAASAGAEPPAEAGSAGSVDGQGQPDPASAAAAASPDAATPDAATPDAATPDAATPDAATPDAPSADAATAEAAPPDAPSTDAADAAAAEAATADTPSADAATADAATVNPAPAPSGTSGVWRDTLTSRGLSASKVQKLATLLASLERDTLPALDADVGSDHGALFRDVIAARRAAERALVPASMTMGQLMRAQTGRWLGAITLLALLAGGIFLLVRTPRSETATASDTYDNSRPDFQASHAIDDDEATEWILPNRVGGWVDVRLSPPRDLSTVRLRNGNNRLMMDRAVKDYTLELYSDDEEVFSQGGQFSGIVRDPGWSDFEVNATQVDRIRVVVRTWHGDGACLAEIDWDEE
ncbi:MAG: discoidin domain-containing protein [Sandaracinaceae bacterium]